MLFRYHSVYILHCGSEKERKTKEKPPLSRGKHSRDKIFASGYFSN